jgi:hypothetical protein
MSAYHLVHIVTSGEYKAPLTQSQVFDRAQEQATVAGPNKPLSVSVWILAPMREVYDQESKNIVKALEKRCPNVKIKLVGGISRLKQWPAPWTLSSLRRALKGLVAYHCRGDASFDWAWLVKKSFPNDAIILDVRGYWPLERLILAGVTDENAMTPAQRITFDADVARLRNAIVHSDWVCTVSEPLRQMIINKVEARKDTVLIPCCVKTEIPDNKRDKIREELKITGKTAILYLGGTQNYQYLDELVIPFIKSALTISDKYVGVFITQNKDKMAAKLEQHKVDPTRTILLSLPQQQVADYLTAIDIGLLLKAPSEINNTSQPVKFGEYLSAGIPVVIEEGTGDLAGMLHQHQIGCVVRLTGQPNQQAIDNEVKNALTWFEQNKNNVRNNARRFVADCYTWKANVPKERTMYIDALNRVNKK